MKKKKESTDTKAPSKNNIEDVKFKFGASEYIASNYNPENIYKITERREDDCLFLRLNSYGYSITGTYWDYMEKEYHPWLVADLKKGDIVVTKDYGMEYHIMIFKECKDNYIYGYVGYCPNDDFVRMDYKLKLLNATQSDVAPASILHKDLLSFKLKEFGLEWDDKKKELRSIDKVLASAGQPQMEDKQ